MRKILRFLLILVTTIVGCGIYDVTRNKNLNEDVLRRYFTGNGLFTWILSPFNTLLDILALPFTNKGVYKLTDLPPDHHAEIRRLIDAAHRERLVERLEERIKDNPRSMIFWKWYGKNMDAIVDIPAFHEEYTFVKTIGISVFNKKQSTTRHFGPVRATLRLLYNVNQMQSREAYIEVGDVKHYWCEDSLFIFDDTLLHQSFNETEEPRYCLFVDVLRPALSPAPFAAVVAFIRFAMQGANQIFYKNWDVIKGKPSEPKSETQAITREELSPTAAGNGTGVSA